MQSRSIAHDLNWKITTTNGGAAYIQECAAAGVPIPEIIADPNDSRWINHGVLQTDFIGGGGSEAELWSYEDPNIDGVCAALPRWTSEDEAELYGVICLGRATSTTCFWERTPYGVFPRYQGISIDEFEGGADLDPGLGECSDCHAGENPFVVHPDDDAFKTFRAARNLTPQAWPRPLVPSHFPGNPGPIEKMPPVGQGEVRCDSCHNAGASNRLPLVSNALDDYCFAILFGATGVFGTMPPGGGNASTHISWLSSLCNAAPVTGRTVPVGNFQPELLSPPILGPVFACSTKVHLSGLVYGATVSLEVDGSPIDIPGPATGPVLEVDVGAALEVNQTLVATQSLDGLTSEEAEDVVQDHNDVYPNGLPPPILEGHVKITNVLTDLSPLSSLVVIEGGLSSGPRFEPFDLDALYNLEVVGEDLQFSLNKITSLQGLSKLHTVGGQLYLFAVPELEDLHGLENVRSVSELHIRSNEKLRSLAGLDGLEEVRGDLLILQNPLLPAEEVDALLARVKVAGEIHRD